MIATNLTLMVAGPLVTVALGFVFLIASARVASRSPATGRRIAITAATIAAIAGATRYPPMRQVLGPAASLVGGEAVVACLSALCLVGIALGSPTAKTSRSLMALCACLSTLALAGITAGPLLWRWTAPAAFNNYPDADGLLTQSTPMTCAPAAASMLMDRYGFRTSEGAIAELGATNPVIGTNEYILARALERAAAPHAVIGRAGLIGMPDAVRLARPFVAYVRMAGIGGHAVLVESIHGQTITLADPLTGGHSTMSAEELCGVWTGVAIWLAQPLPTPADHQSAVRAGCGPYGTISNESVSPSR